MAPQFTEAGAGKWIHPGISAYRIGDDVEREIQGIVDSVVLEYGNEGG